MSQNTIATFSISSALPPLFNFQVTDKYPFHFTGLHLNMLNCIATNSLRVEAKQIPPIKLANPSLWTSNRKGLVLTIINIQISNQYIFVNKNQHSLVHGSCNITDNISSEQTNISCILSRKCWNPGTTITEICYLGDKLPLPIPELLFPHNDSDEN